MKWIPSAQNRPRAVCLIVLLNVFVIITTGYLILVFHFKENYAAFIIKAVSSRSVTNVTSTIPLFIGIISAPHLIFRRNALRRSWLSDCKRLGIPCWIFTDALDMYGKKLPSHIYIPLQQEKYLHGDLILAESPGGINFARRYLWIAQWANERYNFEYFLRVDDDYFICMDRLLLELPVRPKEKLYWGHVHCQPEGGIRVDEGFVIVTNDLVQEFLREEKHSLMCHPYGDQAMAMWINNISGVTYFGDTRVHHGVSANDNFLQYYSDICYNFLALHGSYPVEIERFWLTEQSMPRTKDYAIPGISYPCEGQDRTYDYESFLGMYHAEPIPCKNLPSWNISQFYGGRSA